MEKGLPDKGPFDVIVLEGSIYGDPSVLLAQLEPGGRLVGIRVEGRLGQATVWRRTGDGFGRTESFEAAGGQLPGFEPVAAFIF